MTDEHETVAVPVELLSKIHDHLDDEFYRTRIEALLPQPKPRLVAVDLDEWPRGTYVSDLKDHYEDEPDLMDTLDAAIDDWISRPPASLPTAQLLKDGIRAALGVTA